MTTVGPRQRVNLCAEYSVDSESADGLTKWSVDWSQWTTVALLLDVSLLARRLSSSINYGTVVFSSLTNCYVCLYQRLYPHEAPVARLSLTLGSYAIFDDNFILKISPWCSLPNGKTLKELPICSNWIIQIIRDKIGVWYAKTGFRRENLYANISETEQDTDIVFIECLYKIAYGLLFGDIIFDGAV